MRRLVFLVGSGVSRAAQLPGVVEITDAVVSGRRDGLPYKRLSDGHYTNASGIPDLAPRRMIAVLALIREIQRRCKSYFGRDVNYEDIAYIGWQVRDQQSGNYENVALVPFIRSLRRTISKDDGPLGSLAPEVCTYIHCVVRDMLSNAACGLGHLRCITEVCRAEGLDHVDIFTLNHDTLLEQELEGAGITFCDGFEQRTDTCDYWVGSAFVRRKSKVQLGKLHGSVDWYLYRPDRSNPMKQMVGKPKTWETLNLSGEPQRPVDDESVMLIGSFNKILEYTAGIFADLFCAWRFSLNSAQRLVVSGYGFGDKGVNHSIIEWLRGSSQRRLIIVHQEPEKLKQCARKAIRQLLSTNASQVLYVHKWFQNTTFAELQTLL